MTTKIEWAQNPDGSKGESWNPLRARNKKTGKVGWHCTKVSAGCEHCYSETLDQRFGTGEPYKPNRDMEFFLHENTLAQPLRWKKPRRIFVCSMTDLFHPDVPFYFIDQVFAVMALARWHQYICLTKRPERALVYLNHHPQEWGEWAHFLHQAVCSIPSVTDPYEHEWMGFLQDNEWPLLNCWLGVSVEDQKTADERIPVLLQCPATIRWVSYEPALSGVDFTPWLPGLNWAVVGGESGPNARPSDPDWFRKVRNDCKAAGVPYFQKQMFKKGPIPPDLMIREFPDAGKGAK